MDSGPLPKHAVEAWTKFLNQTGKKWTDAPGGRYVVKATNENEDGYGLKDHEHNLICIATFQPTIIQNQNFYQLQIIANVGRDGGNFYPMQTLLWTIKEHIKLPIIDYGSQSPQGSRFTKALGKTKRFNMYWFNVETGEKNQYNPNEDQIGVQPYRGASMTPWKIVVENEIKPSFPLNESEFDLLSHTIPCELFGEEWDETCKSF